MQVYSVCTGIYMFQIWTTLTLYSATLTEAGQFKCVNVTGRFNIALLLFFFFVEAQTPEIQTPEHRADFHSGDHNQPTT